MRELAINHIGGLKNIIELVRLYSSENFIIKVHIGIFNASTAKRLVTQRRLSAATNADYDLCQR